MLMRGWAGGDKSSNGGLHISSRTSKQYPLRSGGRARNYSARAHGTGDSVAGDDTPAMVLWELMTMSMNSHQWTGHLWMDVG